MEKPALDILGGKPILFVMAVPMEYGPALNKRIKPLMCGVGPVEAAMNLSRALEILRQEGVLPAHVVSLGSAGSHKLDQGEIYQVSSVSYRDMDASPLGFDKGVTPFLDHPVDIPLAALLDTVPSARLSSGANIVSGTAYDAIDADMVDMETFALKRVTDSFKVPLTGFRGISDGKEELSKYEDWADYLHDIDEKLGHVVDELQNAF